MRFILCYSWIILMCTAPCRFCFMFCESVNRDDGKTINECKWILTFNELCVHCVGKALCILCIICVALLTFWHLLHWNVLYIIKLTCLFKPFVCKVREQLGSLFEAPRWQDFNISVIGFIHFFVIKHLKGKLFLSGGLWWNWHHFKLL